MRVWWNQQPIKFTNGLHTYCSNEILVSRFKNMERNFLVLTFAVEIVKFTCHTHNKILTYLKIYKLQQFFFYQKCYTRKGRISAPLVKNDNFSNKKKNKKLPKHFFWSFNFLIFFVSVVPKRKGFFFKMAFKENVS